MRITVRRMLLGFAALVVAVVAFSLHAYRQRPEAIDAALTAQDHSPLLALGDVVDRGPSVLETIGFGLHAAVRWAKDEALVLREERDLLLPPKPGAPTDLVVHVSDEDGVPQPGAVVVVFAQAGVSRPRDGLTDAEGRIRFTGLPAAEGYVVDVGVPSLLQRVQRVVHLTPGRTAALNVRLRGVGRYVGTVTWEGSGRPVPAAAVVVRTFSWPVEDVLDLVAYSFLDAPAPGGVVAQTRADEHGRFETRLSRATLLAGLCWVTATDPQATGVRGKFASVEWERDPPDEDRLALRPVELVAGRVRTAAGGALPGVVIRTAGLDADHPGGWDNLSTTVSDHEGAFRVRVPSRPHRVELPFAVSVPGGPTHLVRMKAGASGDILIPQETTVQVVVVDVADGRPIPGADVSVEFDESDSEGPSVDGCIVRADDEGVANLPVSKGVVYHVRASAPGYQRDPEGALSRSPEVRPGRVCSLRVPLVRSVRFDVVGRVLSRSDLSIDWTSWSSTSIGAIAPLDPNGRFRLVGVRNEFDGERSWGTSILLIGFPGLNRRIEVDPPRDGAPLVVDLGDLPPVTLPAYLVGRVVDETGRPLAGATVSDVTTDAHGWYCIPVVPAELRSEEVSMSAPGLLADEVRVAGVLREGEVRQVRTQVLRRPSVFRFTVLEANGSPAVGAVVSFPERKGTSAVEREVGADGVVEGAWEPSETITLRAADGASFDARRAGGRRAPAPPTVLRLPRRHVVEGVVVAPDGRGIAQAWVWSRWKSPARPTPTITSSSGVRTDADGRFSLAVPLDARALQVKVAGYQDAEVSISPLPRPLRIEMAMAIVAPVPDAALDRAEALQREGIDDLVRYRREELPWSEYKKRRDARHEEIESLLGD